jgi:hypothetical protein
MNYSTFQDFVGAARSGRAGILAANALNSRTNIYNSKASTHLPNEGVAPAVFPGHHLYVMLQLTKQLTTSSDNLKRQKNIKILAELTQGVRNIVRDGFEGALLEAQGPVIHAFIPDEDGFSADPFEAALAIHAFVNKRIKAMADDSFVKAIVSYCHGPSIFVASVDLHGDNSIVSLAPAANAPAKVLWTKTDELPSGSIVEVELDGSYRVKSKSDISEVITNFSKIGALNSRAASLPQMTLVEARELSVSQVDAPDSPTVEDPQKSFSISIRADQDGFTKRVEEAFSNGREAVDKLAHEFHAIMVHARTFCSDKRVIHLPWAGDCLNLLIAVDDREAYQENRKRRIFEILTEWAFSCSAGDLESNQACNTLVSRIRVGEMNLLLATGLPVERSLQAFAVESPLAGKGVLWKEDVAWLDPDFQAIIEPCPGGRNFRQFLVSGILQAQKKKALAATLLAPPSVYVPTKAQERLISQPVPTSRPYGSD